MGSGLQPRGLRAPLLVGDFKYKIDIKSEDVEVPKTINDAVHSPFQGIPLHSKLIASQVVCEVGEVGEKRMVEVYFRGFSFPSGVFAESLGTGAHT